MLTRAGPDALPTGTLSDAIARQIDECNPQHTQRGYRWRHPDRGFSMGDLENAPAGMIIRRQR